MRFKFWAATAALAVLGLANAASAQVTYSITTSSGSDTSGNYTGTGSISVNVYLTETLTGGATTMIGPGGSETGLATASFGITNSNSGSATITTATVPSSFGAAAPFSEGQVNSNGTAAAILGNLALGSQSGATATQVNSTTYELLVGTFAITVGSTATTYSIGTAYAGSEAQENGAPSFVTYNTGSDLVSAADNNGTSENYVGAYDNGATYSFSVGPQSSVPEPSSMALCGLVVAGAGYFGYRRRNKVQAEVALGVA